MEYRNFFLNNQRKIVNVLNSHRLFANYSTIAVDRCSGNVNTNISSTVRRSDRRQAERKGI